MKTDRKNCLCHFPNFITATSSRFRGIWALRRSAQLLHNKDNTVGMHSVHCKYSLSCGGSSS